MSDIPRAVALALTVLAANWIPLYASIGLCHELMEPEGARGVVCSIPLAGNVAWLLATPTVILVLALARRPRREITHATVAALALAGVAFAAVSVAPW